MGDDTYLNVSAYRDAAASSAIRTENYKGLAIYALPETHTEAVNVAAKKISKGSHVLDIASGSGALCLRLQDAGFSLTACDVVEENFRLHNAVPFFKVNLNASFSDAFDRKFSLITATDIIEHIENPRHFIRQCFALLNPGGLLIITTPNIDSSFSKAYWSRSGSFLNFDEREYAHNGHITPIPIFLLKAAFKEAGFEVSEVRSLGEVDRSFSSWWKMHLFSWIIRRIDQSQSPQKHTIFAVAKKPAP